MATMIPTINPQNEPSHGVGVAPAAPSPPPDPPSRPRAAASSRRSRRVVVVVVSGGGGGGEAEAMPRTRLRVWFVTVCAAIVAWTCLVQLIAFGRLWRHRSGGGASSAESWDWNPTRILFRFGVGASDPSPAPPPLPPPSTSFDLSRLFNQLACEIVAVVEVNL